MKFSFSVGTTLRCGARTLEVVRELNDAELQLEDVLTKRPIIKTRSELLKAIWNETYQVVLPGCTDDAAQASTAVIDVAEDLSSLSDKDQAVIEYRLAYVKGVYAAKATRGQRQRVARAIETTFAGRKKSAEEDGKAFNERKPSASSVMDWMRKYQDSGHCPMSLLSGNRSRRCAPRIDPAFERLMGRIIREVYLTRDQHTLQHTLDRLHEEADKLVETRKLAAKHARTSLATLSRRIRQIDLYARLKARHGEARARYVCRTTMAGAAAHYTLERVEIDHTRLNWVVICDRTGLPLGRATLTAKVDAFSGYLVGLYVSFYGPGLTSVSGVLRNGIMPKDEFTAGMALEHPWLSYGVADEFVLDNGLEFHAKAFRLMAWELGSDLMYCRVRTSWLKPHIERFFASLNYLTLAKGRVHKKVANVLNIDPMKDAAIMFSDLVRGLTMFVADVHPFEVNERKLARPYDLFMEGLQACPPAQYPGS